MTTGKVATHGVVGVDSKRGIKHQSKHRRWSVGRRSRESSLLNC